MRVVYITPNKPKNVVKLDPLDPEDINVDLQLVTSWSRDNKELYELLLENGMAEWICNLEFLYSFYKHICFESCRIGALDSESLRLSNLKELNLVGNKISVLENVPLSVVELYIDFNSIEEVKLSQTLNLELLSISNNCINDASFVALMKRTPHLRCLNISYNRLEDIRRLV